MANFGGPLFPIVLEQDDTMGEAKDCLVSPPRLERQSKVPWGDISMDAEMSSIRVEPGRKGAEEPIQIDDIVLGVYRL